MNWLGRDEITDIPIEV
ncbi:hypothetical protein D047_1283A, partial [Vibrio parahaemolyticus VPTS-2010_2]